MKKSSVVFACLSTIATSSYAAPDLICSEINGAILFGDNGKGINSYAFGTTVCNIGDEAVDFDPDTNQHPVISQTLYKLKDHQIAQIGIGFVRHTTTALNGNACGLGCTPAGLLALGAGCSDTSGAAVNGSQGLMGPRTEIDPQTGFYPYPFTAINQTGDAVYKRLQVAQSDISDPDALYFVETQVISPSETTLETRDNNMSYRQVIFQSGTLAPMLTGPTYSEQPAIYAWRDHGNGIGIPDDKVIIGTNNFPDIAGAYVVGSRMQNLGIDHWRYHYAVLNMNSDLGVRQLDIPNLFCSSPDAEVVSSDFYAPSYHDDLDEQIVNTPWVLDVNEVFDLVTLSTDSFGENPDANAIRWGTMYTFSFDAENSYGGSSLESVGLQFFGPDQKSIRWYGFWAWAPAHCDPFCGPDLDGSGEVDFFDLSFFLTNEVDYYADGDFDFFDISEFLSDFGAGCP